MASYAAATSLTNLLEQVQSYQDRHPVLLDEQLRQLASIQEKVSSFQTYLESYHGVHTKEAQDLEGRISESCYAAEDVIESHIVDYIHLKNECNLFTSLSRLLASFLEKICCLHRRLEKRSDSFSHELQKVIDEMDSIVKEVEGIKEKGSPEDQESLVLIPVGSIRPPPTETDIFVGHGDLLKSVIDKIVRGQPNRQIIPITGMGGIGKTTFARSIYDSRRAKQHFDIFGWVTVSQVYDIGKLLLRLLYDIKALGEGQGEHLAVHELGEILHKYLWKRRYVIVLDDMWSTEAWDTIQRFLPDNSNGSRVVVTSRLLHVTNCIDPSNHFEMNLLDVNESWKLLQNKAFGEKNCPPELEEVGKRIAINCKGLPLAVVVIGGLLAKSGMILRDWEEISANISEIVNSTDDESCLDVLSLSYNHLPVYLKPCFLYIGVFPEDAEIRVSRLINLWVVEGFLKPIHGKSMEEAAELYLTDLIERNLIFVSGRKRGGAIRDCKTHDLLRDLCLREAKKCRFISFITEQIPTTQDMSSHRRIGVQCMRNGDLPPQICHALRAASFLRSVVEHSSHTDSDERHPLLQLKYFKLLRVLDVTEEYPPEVIFQLVNSRYISYQTTFSMLRDDYLVTSLNLFWNIQTLVIGHVLNCTEYTVSSILWEMPQLRHINIYEFVMPEPPSRNGGRDIVVQKNLQTLFRVRDFKLTEEILNGRPNIKKLKICQGWDRTELSFSDYSLNNLVFLHNLQSLHCWFGEQFSRIEVLSGIKFPLSLKKLTLVRGPLEWDDMATVIGDLPQLEKLELNHCRGQVWNPMDGQFLSLKVLKITNQGPREWNVDSTHFPVLEQLILSFDFNLDLAEIPPGIGDIETLQSIHVYGGRESLATSAEEILEEQKRLGNADFEVIIKRYDMYLEDSNEEK